MLFYSGRLLEAEASYRQLLVIERQRNPPRPEFELRILLAYGDLLRLLSKLPEAERELRRAERISEPLRDVPPDVRSALQNNLAIVLRHQKKYVEAEQAYLKSIQLKERANGENSLDLVGTLSSLALVHLDQDQLLSAEAALNRAMAIARKHARDPAIAWPVHRNLAELKARQGQHGEAVNHLQQALAIANVAFGATSQQATSTKAALDATVAQQRLLSDPIAIAARQLEAMRTKSGEHSRDYVAALLDLAQAERRQGDFTGAVQRSQEAATRAEKVGARGLAGLARTIQSSTLLAMKEIAKAEAAARQAVADVDADPTAKAAWKALARLQRAALADAGGRFDVRREIAEQALALLDPSGGYPDTETAAAALEVAQFVQGLHGDARSIAMARASLLRFEQELGPSHPKTAEALDALILALKFRGRWAEVLPLEMRLLQARRARFGASDPSLLSSLHNLATVHIALKEFDRAEKLIDEALGIIQKHKLPDQELTAFIHQVAGDLARTRGDYPRASQHLARSIAIIERTDANSARLTNPLHSMASLEYLRGRLNEAIRYAERARDIDEKQRATRGGDSRYWDTSLAVYYLKAGRAEQSLDIFRGASASSLALVRNAALVPGLDQVAALAQHGPSFAQHARAALVVAGRQAADSAKLLGEAFVMTQYAGMTTTAAVLARLGTRLAAGNGDEARKVRAGQDGLSRLQALDRELNAELSRPVPERREPLIRSLRTSIAAVEQSLVKTRQELGGLLPASHHFEDLTPLSVQEAQKLLRANEAMVVLDVREDGGLAFLLTPTELRVREIGEGEKRLREQVFALRCGLDETAWRDNGGAVCAKALRLKTPVAEGAQLPFDSKLANQLFVTIFGDLASRLAGKELLIVPSAPLSSLPFHALVMTPPPNGSAPSDPAIAWLGTRHAMTMLPSVASLRSIRSSQLASSGRQAYLGVGDPVLQGTSDCPRPVVPASCPHSIGGDIAARASRGSVPTTIRAIYRNGTADLEEVRRLCPLPDTAMELRCVADSFKERGSQLLLSGQATESKLKAMSRDGQLAQYRILHFATHGLLASEVQSLMRGQAEPALVLTPPQPKSARPADAGDGLLTAGEIADLKLDADWVIMSACNTAAGGGSGSEALSGLAKAFFYAGARSLLVSHWEVYSSAAVRLTTQAFSVMAEDRSVGRGEAMRRAMAGLVARGGRSAHPAYWAPFVVVGEGGPIQH